MNDKDREWIHNVDRKLSTLIEQNKNQYHTLNEIKECLFGNGQEGLFTTVTKHKVYFALLGAALSILAGKLLFYP